MVEPGGDGGEVVPGPDGSPVSGPTEPEPNGHALRSAGDLRFDGRQTGEEATAEVPLRGRVIGDGGNRPVGMGEEDPGMKLRLRLEARERYVRELHDEAAVLRVAADEAAARVEAGEQRVRDLEEDRARLREEVRRYEEEERRRRRRREGQDRRMVRLEREIERREDEIERLRKLLDRKEGEFDLYGREAEDMVSRKDVALEDSLRRVEGLERDLEEREAEGSELRATIAELRAELELEYELRRRMAEPANRLRAGIDLFNDSEHARSVAATSKSLGPPEVRVDLEAGNEPPVVLTFVWRGDAPVRWTYRSNPGLAVEEPRVYLSESVDGAEDHRREPPNARLGPDGRVLLGL